MSSVRPTLSRPTCVPSTSQPRPPSGMTSRNIPEAWRWLPYIQVYIRNIRRLIYIYILTSTSPLSNHVTGLFLTVHVAGI